jgi:hypothetical protein
MSMYRAKLPFVMAIVLPILCANNAASQEQTAPNHSLTRSESRAVFGYDPSPDFAAFTPQYRTRINQYKDEIERLRQEMFRLASAGRKTPCARAIFVEAQWLVQFTADFDRIEKRLQALRDILKQPADPPRARDQSPVDGSFNPCDEVWFYKLGAACDKLVVMQFTDTLPKRPLRFLDQINSPEKYRAYMDRLLIADVRKTGEDTRTELNLAGTDLVRLILGKLPSGYTFHPQLKQTMLDYLDNKWQDPKTGFWGCWYKTKDGDIRKTADISATFHIVHYRDGKVKNWPQIIKTTLAMKNLEWPYGWLQEGEMSDHHNYDVVTLFHYGWSSMTAEQKTDARKEIRRMLDYCLTKSLRPDGSFNLGDEGTIGGSFEFPCLFLYEIGFFNKENRYWTSEEFPRAREIAKRIAKKIKELKLDDPESQVAQLIVETAD